MPNHRTRAGIGAAALTAAAFVPAAMPTAIASSTAPAAAGQGSDTKQPLTIVGVKIIDGGTLDTMFSNPMDPTKLKVEQFQAPHYYWVIPHTHIAVAFKLLDGNKTVRTVLDRGLHPTSGRCEGAAISQADPRCSDDTLEWQIDGAVDKFGQTIQNNDWKVWLPDKPGGVGAKKHPAACRPGCP